MMKNVFAVMRFIAGHPLNAGHRIGALINFFSWQIGARLLKKKMIVPWVDDCKFVTGLGETGLTGNLYAGFTEYQDMLFLLHALQPEVTFVDVGANVGAYTILAAKVAGARAIAFEPLPETADRLRDQVQINRVETTVDVRNMGIGAQRGELYFTNNGDTVNKVSISGNVDNTVRVSVSTLDDELPAEGHYFLKIDVEGFEFNVLKGAARLLKSGNVEAIIIELNGSGEEYGHSNNDIHQVLIASGLEPVSYDPFTRALTRLSGYNSQGGNTIYVRDYAAMASLCLAAPKRKVHTANGIMI